MKISLSGDEHILELEAEIERLHGLDKQNTDLAAIVREQGFEIERLKAALQKMVIYCAPYAEDFAEDEAVTLAFAEARDALEGNP